MTELDVYVQLEWVRLLCSILGGAAGFAIVAVAAAEIVRGIMERREPTLRFPPSQED